MPTLYPVIPVISRSPDRANPRNGPLWRPISKGRMYGDEPLPILPSTKAPRSARIVARFADPDRVAYTVKIGEELVEDVRLDEVLDYVSAYDLEQFEYQQFVEEGEALRIAEIAEREEAERRKERAKLRAKRKGIVLMQSDDDDDESEEEVATGKHGRARPTYTHLFLKPQQRRRRRKRDPVTGDLMDLSEEEEFVVPTVARTNTYVRPPASESADLPKRRRRKRDPVTGELLPLDPLPQEGSQRASSTPGVGEQSGRSSILSSSVQIGLQTEKKRRRKRHPLTNKLMPIGWRYDPEAEKESYQQRRDGVSRSSNAGSPSMHRLSISKSQEHASKRIKLGSESSSDGLPVTETVRSPASKPLPQQSSTPTKREIIEISESDDAEDDGPQAQNLLSTFKRQTVPKTSMLNPSAKAVPAIPTASSSGTTSRGPLTLQAFLQSGQDESSSDDSASRRPAKTPVVSPNTQRKTSIMNPVAIPDDDEQAEDEDEEQEGEYFVESILAHRLSDPRTHPGRPQTMLYQVKWEGYTDLTWEPEESFADQQSVLEYRQYAGLDPPTAVAQLQTSPKKPMPKEVLSTPEEPSDEDNEEEDGYVVEKILAHHMSDPRTHPGKPRTMLYQVKWVGWPEPTWEPAASFVDKSLLEAYQKKVGLK